MQLILKPVGQMPTLGEFDLPGVLPGVFPQTPIRRTRGGIPRTEKWPKTGHTDDWLC